MKHKRIEFWSTRYVNKNNKFTQVLLKTCYISTQDIWKAKSEIKNQWLNCGKDMMKQQKSMSLRGGGL